MSMQSTLHSGLPDNGLAAIRAAIAAAATHAGRAPDSVQLIAVSKAQPMSAIRALAAQGQRDFGESYLQEALPKLSALNDLALTWHFIGQLQSNKTRVVAEQFAWAHALDRERIAVRLSEQRPHYAPPLNICLQVKLAEEPGKGGVWPNEVAALADAVAKLPRLRLRGLMCVPPPSEDYASQLQHFTTVARLQAELNEGGHALDVLSMGMSGDFSAAIAAGATHVRIGTALFGARHR